MVRETYSKPEFGFQEMALFERVAAKCWGNSAAWLDLNRDGLITSVDFILPTSGGCEGQNAADALNVAISGVNATLNAFNESDQDYSILEGINSDLAVWASAKEVKYIQPIEAVATANWANTKAKESGIIIIGS